MYPEDVIAKMPAEQQQNAQCASPAPSKCCDQNETRSTYRSSLKDEAAKSAQFHSDEAIKAAKAHSFLATHPEFDEFIQLIRAGAIRI
jgi:hypothetical protein